MRVRWDGTTDERRSRAPEGVYRVRREPAPRRPRGDAQAGHALDLTRARPTVLAGGPDGHAWITGPVGRAGAVPRAGRLATVPDPHPRAAAPTCGAPREVATLQRSRPASARASGTGRAGGAPAPPGTYQIVAAVRDQAGNVGRSAPDGARRRARRARRQRALAARPPARRPRARRRGGRRSPSTRAAARTAGGSRAPAAASADGPRERRRAAAAAADARPQAHRRRAHGRARPAATPASTCSRPRGPDATRRRVPFAVQGERDGADPRRAPGRHLVRARHARRRPRRRPEHARERQLRPRTRGCSRAGCRTASATRSPRCSRSSTSRRSATTSRPT